MSIRKICLFALLLFPCPFVFAQQAFFVDGFHGGIWGHYPVGYTSFMVNQLEKHPNWNINLEIEPETWARDIKLDAKGYKAFQELLKDKSSKARVEYVNPAYGQPYMFNISGESIIRQFAYGISTLKTHFPTLTFNTYSSEEPCFTSALPQILTSFGFKYSSLKNPNTCWGGYTTAHGKELVNWIGPDGTAILTSPRYAIEALTPGSTWETIASSNSPKYISAAFADGIKNPVGMCLQDAGWYYGPWLKGNFYKPTTYTTWTNYFENIAAKEEATDWKFTQEDVLTSLVWGSQAVQQLAQQIRNTENKIIQTEKIAVIDQLDQQKKYPVKAFDEAWRNLMLSQHHDCWIVPYNGDKGDTWIDKVSNWTSRSNFITDSVTANSTVIKNDQKISYLKVYNTLGTTRDEWVTVALPAGFTAESFTVTDHLKRVLPYQLLSNRKSIVFRAKVPPMGYAVFELQKTAKKSLTKGASAVFTTNGNCILETDLYRIQIDKAKGGTLKSLVAKQLNQKEFVDGDSERAFNELRGNFYKKGGFKSTTTSPAKITVVEPGPFLVIVKIESEIEGNPVTHTLKLFQGQKQIDFNLNINWKQNEGIGEFEETKYNDRTLRKAFYDDRYKLLTLFPLALKNQKVYKNAPFDVTESRLKNTFFNTWDSIKNNIVLNWVDVVSGDQQYGMAMFTDHTTSYAHGEDFPLGLTTQYSGMGLWGRNYRIKNATEINYKLLPHGQNWQKAGISYESEKIKEPLQVSFHKDKPSKVNKSYVSSSNAALEISSFTIQNDELHLRLFNAATTAYSGKVKLNFPVNKATLVNMDGTEIAPIKLTVNGENETEVNVNFKPFGINTLKISKR